MEDSEAEVQNELKEAQLRDEQQHSEVQALSGSPRRVVHDVVQVDVQRLDAESNELSQRQKQLHMRTEVAADDLAQVRQGLKNQEKLVQKVVTSFEVRAEVRAEVKCQGTQLHELRRELAEYEKSMQRLFNSEMASERKAT